MSKKRNGHKPPQSARNYRYADHHVAQRKCLGECGKMFTSKSPANRICPACTKRSDAAHRSRMQEGPTGCDIGDK